MKWKFLKKYPTETLGKKRNKLDNATGMTLSHNIIIIIVKYRIVTLKVWNNIYGRINAQNKA